jgi:putative ABC transport system substrate-binding protein
VDRHLRGPPAALAAKAATSTLPIVFSVGIDPVKLGLVAAWSVKGGNVTGVSQFSTALEGKRLELLHELVPNATVIAMLVNPAFPGTDLITNDMGVAARALGLKLNVLTGRLIPRAASAHPGLARSSQPGRGQRHKSP